MLGQLYGERKRAYHHSSPHAGQRPKVKTGPLRDPTTQLRAGLRARGAVKPPGDVAAGAGSGVLPVKLFSVRSCEVRASRGARGCLASLAHGVSAGRGRHTQTSARPAADTSFRRFHRGCRHETRGPLQEAEQEPVSHRALSSSRGDSQGGRRATAGREAVTVLEQAARAAGGQTARGAPAAGRPGHQVCLEKAGLPATGPLGPAVGGGVSFPEKAGVPKGGRRDMLTTSTDTCA